MANSWEIFARCDLTLEQFAREAESILNIRTKKVEDEVGSRFTFIDDDVYVIINDHSFDNDREANFQDYSFYISMVALRHPPPMTSEESIARRDRFAYAAFEKLRRTERFALMMTDNLQTVLRRYDRPPASSRE